MFGEKKREIKRLAIAALAVVSFAAVSSVSARCEITWFASEFDTLCCPCSPDPCPLSDIRISGGGETSSLQFVGNGSWWHLKTKAFPGAPDSFKIAWGNPSFTGKVTLIFGGRPNSGVEFPISGEMLLAPITGSWDIFQTFSFPMDPALKGPDVAYLWATPPNLYIQATGGGPNGEGTGNYRSVSFVFNDASSCGTSPSVSQPISSKPSGAQRTQSLVNLAAPSLKASGAVAVYDLYGRRLGMSSVASMSAKLGKGIVVARQVNK